MTGVCFWLPSACCFSATVRVEAVRRFLTAPAVLLFCYGTTAALLSVGRPAGSGPSWFGEGFGGGRLGVFWLSLVRIGEVWWIVLAMVLYSVSE